MVRLGQQRRRVRQQDERSALTQASQRSGQLRLPVQVQPRLRLIEDHERSIREPRTRHQQATPLPHGQTGAALIELRLQAPRTRAEGRA